MEFKNISKSELETIVNALVSLKDSSLLTKGHKYDISCNLKKDRLDITIKDVIATSDIDMTFTLGVS